MDSVTFSDSQTTEDNTLIFSETENTSSALSIEEYCKRHPDSLECLEYDV